MIAIFILTFGFAVVARLFHAGLAYEAHTDAQQMASLVAESKMEEIRGWNWQVHRPGNSPFSDWSAYPETGAPTFNPAPNAPDFLVGVNSTVQELYSPCTQFESLYVGNPNPDRQPRVAEQAARWVRVSVKWSNRIYYLESMITPPPAPVGSPSTAFHLSTSPDGPLTIAQNGVQTFTPTVQDSNGNDLPGVFFQWDLNGIGDGTVNATRSGDSCKVTNEIFDSTGAQMGYGAGASAVDYVCRARGIDLVHETKTVTFSN